MVMLFVGVLFLVLVIIINCLCGFGMDVIGFVYCFIVVGEVDFIFVGGVEFMLWVLFVMGKV